MAAMHVFIYFLYQTIFILFCCIMIVNYFYSNFSMGIFQIKHLSFAKPQKKKVSW